MKVRRPGDAAMDILIGHGHLEELVWFDTCHSGSPASPHMYKKQQGPHGHEGVGWSRDHLLAVKIKITLLRSTLNTCVIHRANWFFTHSNLCVVPTN